ncbi:uncharacterized protein N7459_000720 [Penicillium hispanicum]|uniref:uncharacterized protein n=1 Tax=Penicillium hispanicum TaxID=1080232 RepID=UPI00253FC7FA|nr:uncharacterized protein N7459_000720 [Penicillium hispanicum]KAJ5594512.1 hypothetical protein N7459_000720 [Penicillium hispanicum]
MGLFRSAFGISLVALAAILAPVGIHFVKPLGIFYTPKPTVLGDGEGPIRIEDTLYCEDVHHYRPANLLFTACEDSKVTRFEWFPGLGHLNPQSSRGSIHVVDPKKLTKGVLCLQTMKSTRLNFQNFEGSFVTHGIDVIGDPAQGDAVYIFAVNHLPNPEYFEASGAAENIPKARSQIELFRHVLQSDSVQHVRSIRHPLVYTPNDIYAVSPHSFYVTNDHFYRDGTRRLIEDAWPSAKWSNVIHVQLTDLNSVDATAGLDASIALTGLWNNNGLGHGRTDQELVISSAMGGELYVSDWHAANNTISVKTSIPFDCITDNPSYYADPYRTHSDDASGIVIAGVTRGFYLAQTGKDPNALDPMQVWIAQPKVGTDKWEKKLLFEDDGSRIRTASAAVLVPIEPKADGTKRAWLFVTGFLSESMVAVQVEL